MTNSSVELKNLNPDTDPRLMETPLPNVLALQKGLRGDELSNPEIYLREFLNASHYFRQLSNGDEYKKQIRRIMEKMMLSVHPIKLISSC